MRAQINESVILGPGKAITKSYIKQGLKNLCNTTGNKGAKYPDDTRSMGPKLSHIFVISGSANHEYTEFSLTGLNRNTAKYFL